MTTNNESLDQPRQEFNLDALQRGDVVEVRRFVERLTPVIYRTLRIFHLSDDDAEEIVQTVLVRLLTSDSLKPPINLIQRAILMARNAALQHLRRSYRSRKMQSSLDQIDAVATTEYSLSRDNDDLRLSLERALSELSPQEHHVVSLRYILGHSTAETAEILGVSEGAVRVRLARAARRLRASLSELTDQVEGQ